MTPGIDVKDLIVGTGALAERGKVVLVHTRTFLNRGEERLTTDTQGRPTQIHLGKREAIAGLEQGIEGMRVGGRRELIISPHLAYGELGVPGYIPPNAVLRCEVELVEVREPGISKPEDFPPGKQLVVINWGEAARNRAKWQFGVPEDRPAGVSVTKAPPPGATWRHMRGTNIPIELSPGEKEAIFEEVFSIPQKFPEQTISSKEIGVDHSEKANTIHRHSPSDVPCLNIHIWERGHVVLNYYLREDSLALLQSRFYNIAFKAVENHLAKNETGEKKGPGLP